MPGARTLPAPRRPAFGLASLTCLAGPTAPARWHPRAKVMLTFSVVMSVSASCRFWVKMMLKTAWERLLVSFMFVAATVLGEWKSHAVASHPVGGYEGHRWCRPAGLGHEVPAPCSR